MEEGTEQRGGLLAEAPDAGSRSYTTKEGEEQKKIIYFIFLYARSNNSTEMILPKQELIRGRKKKEMKEIMYPFNY
jgi:hypothetical protein